jgi:hypothetical protein
MNGSNCAFAYYRSPNKAAERSWHLNHIGSTLSARRIPRESVAFIAGVGTPLSLDTLKDRILEAKEKCKLGSFDIVMTEWTVEDIEQNEDEFTSVMNCLEELCKVGEMSGHAMKISQQFYDIHSPGSPQIDTSAQILATMPKMVETLIKGEFQHTDFVAYQISPTSKVPYTQSMLGMHEDEVDKDLGGRRVKANMKSSAEQLLSMDPADAKQLEEVEARPQTYSRAVWNPLDCYRGDPNVEETQQRSATYKRSKSDSGCDDEMEQQGIPMHTNTPVVLFSGHPSLRQYDVTGGSMNAPNEEQRREIATATGPCAVELEINKTLDRLVPKLETSQTIHEKALRIALSVDTDVAILDALTSANLGKCTLSRRDMLSFEETAGVFESFHLPLPDDVDLSVLKEPVDMFSKEAADMMQQFDWSFLDDELGQDTSAPKQPTGRRKEKLKFTRRK